MLIQAGAWRTRVAGGGRPRRIGPVPQLHPPPSSATNSLPGSSCNEKPDNDVKCFVAFTRLM
jgi:hypothetical protein